MIEIQYLKIEPFKDLEQIFVFGDQVHGNNVQVVTNSGIVESCDGLITNRKSLTLAFADCACVFLYSYERCNCFNSLWMAW